MIKTPNEKKFSEILDYSNNGLPIISLNEYDSVNYAYNNTELDIEEIDDKNKLAKEYDINLQTITDTKEQKKLHIDVGGYVGSVPLSKFIINVEPKFEDIQSYGRLIHYVNGFDDAKFSSDRIDFLESKNQTLYWHIELLMKYTTTILKEGLYKNYIIVQEDTPYLKGKLLLLPTETTSGQILNDSRFNLQFSCEHDEFSANTLENQILLYTLDYCQRKSPIPHQKMQIQRRIHEIDYDVSMPNLISSNEFEKLHYTSMNKRYENALVCCEQILSGFGFESLRKQKTEFIQPFFIKMNDLFQDFIACLLRDSRYYPNRYVKADQYRNRAGEKEQQTKRAAWRVANATRSIKPDIITYMDHDKTKIHAIIDAKYKDDKDVYVNGKMSPKRLGESDMYQIAFYLNDYKKKVAYAVLPGHKNSQDDYDIQAINQGLEIRVRHINVEETLDWIFNKTDENTNNIIEMLKEKFPY